MLQEFCSPGEDGIPQYQNLVDGRWQAAEAHADVRSPVDGSLLGRVPAMGRQEADAAFAAAKAARGPWAKTPLWERARFLYRAADKLEKDAGALADILCMEIAKDRASALAEVQRTVDFIRYTADVGKGLAGEAMRGESFPGGSREKLSFVSREPLGTVLAIAPFNYPVNLSASKVAPALMGGNTVVLKPPSQGAISTLHLARAFQQAGLPAGVLGTVTGRGSELGDYLAAHQDVSFINFTGSTQVGQHIAAVAGMVPLLLELGGKDAAIVLEDADLDFAAKNIVSGAYAYSGQRCTALKRILAVGRAAQPLVERMRGQVLALRCGDPRQEGVQVVPLIDSKAADYVDTLIDDALSKGAKALTPRRREGNLLSPLLLDRVTTEMRIAWEEPFGPVLPVLRVASAEEAVGIANRSQYGLQASVFTRDIDRAFALAERLEVGTVQINNKTERGPDHFPFLGVKASGMGTQGVRYSIEAMTRPKAVVVNLGGGGV